MADDTGSVASLFGGQPGDGGAPPAPAPGGAPQAAAPTATGGASNFLEAFDPTTREWVQKKGWDSPVAMASSYREIEKLMGGEKLPIPKDPNDKAAWDVVHRALGKPESPEGYGLDKIEGLDKTFAGEAAKAFHDLGLSPKQAQALVEFQTNGVKARMEAAENEFQQTRQLDVNGLKKDWGNQFEPKVEMGRRAATQFGLDNAALESLERAMGTRKASEFLVKVGESFAEAPMVHAQAPTPQAMTPETAKVELARLMKDPVWTKKNYDGDPAARAEMQRLIRIQAGG